MSSPTLLTLPLSIRHKIHSYLLTTPLPPPSKTYLNSPISQRPKYPKFSAPGGTSILRVNRQLHEEGARVLYGCNTFLVWVFVAGEWVSSTEVERGEWGGVRVGYCGPWGGFGVGVREGGGGRYTYRPSMEGTSLSYYPNGDFTPLIPELQDVKDQRIPCIRDEYARYITSFRVEVFEERIPPAWNVDYYGKFSRLVRKNGWWDSRLFLWHVFESFWGTVLGGLRLGDGIGIDVMVYTALTSDPGVYSGGRWDEQPGFEEAVVVLPTLEEYKQLIRTLWPLTSGGEKVRVKFWMPEMLVDMFGEEVVNGVFEECDLDAGGVKDNYREGEGAGRVEMGKECMWVCIGGRRMVVLRTVRCRCG
ncbi:hypothetical protein TWF718_008430 [Orbilia javanica]|uniref:Uncharacterized protein n=1 Tax=Orbilia javanica TaxID=47235 RepID=A0AAN8MYB1_9PEZI